MDNTVSTTWRRSWVLEAHVDHDGSVSLSLFPVDATASLTDYPSASVRLVGSEGGGEDS